jgi:hypothetical protein
MMTVKEICDKCEFRAISMPDPLREVTGGYAGDLLSWVMGRAQSGDAWVTIMTNINIVAVASLADPSCIVLAEGVSPDDGVLERALASGVNILQSEKSSFELCAMIAELL